MRRTVTGITAFLAAFAANAGTLGNSDSSSYDLEISQSGGSTHTSISSNTTIGSTCSYFPCTITNKDTGDKIKVTSPSENVVIRNGKFSIR